MPRTIRLAACRTSGCETDCGLEKMAGGVGPLRGRAVLSPPRSATASPSCPWQSFRTRSGVRVNLTPLGATSPGLQAGSPESGAFAVAPGPSPLSAPVAGADRLGGAGDAGDG